jgi:hypothetical protein
MLRTAGAKVRPPELPERSRCRAKQCVTLAAGASRSTGRYDTELFAAKNLPFLVAMMVEEAVAPLRSAAAVGSAVTGGSYAGLVIVVGSAVIAGCFSPGRALGYRSVYVLLAMPGPLTLARSTTSGVHALASAPRSSSCC